MRVRKRATGLLLGVGVLFLIGTNVQAGWLFVLAALLLGALIAGLALASLGVRPRGRGPRARRDPTGSGDAGRPGRAQPRPCRPVGRRGNRRAPRRGQHVDRYRPSGGARCGDHREGCASPRRGAHRLGTASFGRAVRRRRTARPPPWRRRPWSSTHRTPGLLPFVDTTTSRRPRRAPNPAAARGGIPRA